MAKKIFTYRGKTLEELKELSLKDLAELLPARQRRKIQRGFKESEKIFLQKVREYQAGKRKKPVKTHCRHMIVLPEMVGATIMIHKGKGYETITVTEDMIGHYLGEFALTRSSVRHSAPGIGATRASASASLK